MDPIVLRAGEGESLSLGGNDLVFKAKSADTGGALGLVEYTASPGFQGPPPHTHRELTDMFFVLDGALTFVLGDEIVEAAGGTFVLVPPGVVHTFSNTSSAPARFLSLVAPGGFEHYFDELAEALGGGPIDPAVAGKIMARYDIQIAQ